MSRDGREPLVGVVVAVDGTTIDVTTNQEGEFIIEGLVAGEHQLTFTVADFEELNLMVRVKELVHDMQQVVMIPTTMMMMNT